MSKKQPVSETKLRTTNPLENDGMNGVDGGEPDLTGIDGSTLKNATGGWIRPIIGVRPRTIRMPGGKGDCTYA